MSDRRRLIVRLGAVAIWLGLLAAAGLRAAEGEPTATAPNPHLSSRVRELIRAELPRYLPPALLEDEPAFDTPIGVMRDDTLHLPTMQVREARKAPATSTDWFTGRGRLDFALTRFPGTRIGNFFGTNNPWALARLTEDLEAARHDALKETGSRVLLTESAEDRQTRELLTAALLYSGRPRAK